MTRASPPGTTLPAGRPDGDEPRVVRQGTPSRPWVPPIAAALVALAGFIDILSVLTPEFADRLRLVTRVVTGPVTRSASAATVAVGLLLLLLSHALRRRKRRA